MIDARGALLVLIIQREARERESTKEVTGGGEKKKGEDVANRGKKFKERRQGKKWKRRMLYPETKVPSEQYCNSKNDVTVPY